MKEWGRNPKSTFTTSREKKIEIFLGDGSARSFMHGAFEDSFVEGGFLLFQGHHFFFDGMTHENAQDGDLLCLSNAVGPIRRLVFNRGVPPRIQVKHIGSLGEVQSLPSGF